MFRRRHDPLESERVTLTVGGRHVVARRGETLAAAVLAAGLVPTRHTPVTGSPRAPYCMMGACFDCLMTVDGVPNRQACLVEVQDGMVAEPESGARGWGA